MTRSAPTSRCSSRCTGGSLRTRPFGSRGCLEPFEPAWIEEPVPPENLKALAKVAAKTTLPIATGERIHDRIEFRELFESQAADIIQPDIGHLGGILETPKLAATAETHYVLVAPHNVGGPVLTAASLHLAACTPNFDDPGALQRLRRRGGQAGRSRAPRRDRWLLRAADCAGPRCRARRRLRRRAPSHRRTLRPLRRRLALARRGGLTCQFRQRPRCRSIAGVRADHPRRGRGIDRRGRPRGAARLRRGVGVGARRYRNLVRAGQPQQRPGARDRRSGHRRRGEHRAGDPRRRRRGSSGSSSTRAAAPIGCATSTATGCSASPRTRRDDGAEIIPVERPRWSEPAVPGRRVAKVATSG